MSARTDERCAQADLVSSYALDALEPGELTAFQNHLETCAACKGELGTLRAVAADFARWPTDVLRPTPLLWDRVSQRIATDSGAAPPPPSKLRSGDPDWEDVAPGISCKLLAADPERDRVSMLVKLAPGAHYPPHEHAGVEELHLLDGVLRIDHQELRPGDYYRAERGTCDERVWSETGCTCLLVTSPGDLLR